MVSIYQQYVYMMILSLDRVIAQQPGLVAATHGR